jgi:hypothetical protein
MLVHSVRRGKCTSPLPSVRRSSSCDEPSRLYCCHTWRTVMPVRGLRAASKVVIVQSGATICGTGINPLASTNPAATQTILIRAGFSMFQILIRTVTVDVTSPFRSLTCEKANRQRKLVRTPVLDTLENRIDCANAERAHPQLLFSGCTRLCSVVPAAQCSIANDR